MIRKTKNKKVLNYLKKIGVDIDKQIKNIIKNGSKVIKKTKDCEIVGVRNSRDKYISIYMLFDFNSTSDSCNYENISIACGNF